MRYIFVYLSICMFVFLSIFSCLFVFLVSLSLYPVLENISHKICVEGSLLPLWKFRYVEGGEEEEEGDGIGKKEPLEITSLR